MVQPLQIYNSLTKKKEIFTPIRSPFVGMYLCGPTVYGKAHLGHARAALTFDIVFRQLKQLNYQVRYVRNITDVGHLERDLDDGNDKIQAQAILEEVSPMEVAQRYTNSYRGNMAQLNILPPTIEPCASGHIIEQIEMIKAILIEGLAYVVNGSVYFDSTKYHQMHAYGKLSGRVMEEIRIGTRDLTNQAEKRNPIDFALWKKASPTHLMTWPSPWGEGFPGWHIECTAMAAKYLGKQFDIHGGGMDLRFPHHECEIAQSQAVFQTDLASYWMHNNLVTIDGVKMGKSLGNFITLDALFSGDHSMLDRPYSPMALRFFMLQSHYRATLSVSTHGLQAAYQGYRKLMNGLQLLHALAKMVPELPNIEATLDKEIYADCTACYAVMNDDFHTPKAIALLFSLLKKIYGLHNGQLKPSSISSMAFHQLSTTYATFITAILGLQEEHPVSVTAMVEAIVSIYQQAKAAKQYDQVDTLRLTCHKLGISLQDHPKGTYWSYATP